MHGHGAAKVVTDNEHAAGPQFVEKRRNRDRLSVGPQHVDVIGAGAAPEADEVGHDHPMPGGEAVSDAIPAGTRSGNAVQQHPGPVAGHLG